jgi:hypothetical protein
LDIFGLISIHRGTETLKLYCSMQIFWYLVGDFVRERSHIWHILETIKKVGKKQLIVKCLNFYRTPFVRNIHRSSSALEMASKNCPHCSKQVGFSCYEVKVFI